MIQEQSSSQHHQQLPKYGSAGSATTGVARASRKIKPKKIPQRGLGVAQLEKLRLEEQKKMEGGGVPAAHSRALGGGHLLPPPVPLGALPRPPADCGFSPVLWYNRMPPLPMVSTGLSLTASSSHPTEPPSNQMYGSSGCRSSAAPAPAEEDRDRSWPFMFEGMTAAPSFRTSTGKPTPTVPFPGRMVTRDDAGFADACPPDLSRHEFRTRNYFSASASYSDWSPPDFAYCKQNIMANGCAKETSLRAQQPAKLTKQPTLVIPSSAHLPECSDFLGVMPSPAAKRNPISPSETFCGNLTGEFGLQGSTSASPSPRPFYSFLPAGPVRCERALGECSADVPEAVDLELKL